MKALDSAIVEEFQMASQISEEEWEAIRPTKNERRKYLLEKVQVNIRGKTAWIIKVFQTKTLQTLRMHVEHKSTEEEPHCLRFWHRFFESQSNLRGFLCGKTKFLALGLTGKYLNLSQATEPLIAGSFIFWL